MRPGERNGCLPSGNLKLLNSSLFLKNFLKAGLFFPGRALFVGARTGQEVEAARRLGVSAIGIDLVAQPPLVVYGDMHEIPFKNGEFDFVFTNCFDHALIPSKMIEEIERVTAVGGIICVHVQLNKPDDEFGVTDLFDLDDLVALFSRSQLMIARLLPKPVLAMNSEVLVKKVVQS